MSKLKFIIPAVFMLSIAAFAQDSTSADTAAGNNAEMQQLYMEYLQLNQQLQAVQQQALTSEELSKRSEDFMNKVEDQMIKNDPAVKEKLTERDSIISRYEQMEQSATEEELADLQKKYESVSSELAGYQTKVMQDEALMEEAKQLETAVFNKMQEIEPQINQMIARLEEVTRKLQTSGGGN